jgi:hypothetical protein
MVVIRTCLMKIVDAHDAHDRCAGQGSKPAPTNT